MAVKSTRWSVDIFRKPGHHLGTIEAPDERSAIVKAAETFDIPPQLRIKIAVTRMDVRARGSKENGRNHLAAP
jgi:1,2-phenylacetyl-CoA epoxidase PaaB subunit